MSEINTGFKVFVYGSAAIMGMELLFSLPSYVQLPRWVKLIFIAILIIGARPFADRVIGDR